jgi:dipeptidyl aminopeptidase/acylaminoacyl peptidase
MPRGKRKLSLDDLDHYRHVFDAQVSPDGQTVAFCVGSLTHSNSKYSPARVWTVNLDGGAPQEFTTGPRTDIHPRWSPDGTKLAFMSDRVQDGKFQIFVIPREGGEAVQLTSQQGVSEPFREIPRFHWSPDGGSIAFLMQDAETEEIHRRRDAQDDAIEFEHSPRFTRVWVVDINSKDTRPVTLGDMQVWEFDWSPDAKGFALIVSEAPYEWDWYRARLARVSARGGRPSTILASKKQLAQPRWSPGGKEIAYLSSTWSDRGIAAGDLMVVDARGESRTLTRGYDGSVGWIQWLGDGQSILAASYELGESALNVFDARTGACRHLWREPELMAESFSPRFSRARNGAIAVVRASPASPRDVWVAQETRGRLKWKQLTRMNPQIREVALGDQEIVRWTSRDGVGIQGILIKPAGYKEGRHVPLVVIPHGGPTSLYANGFYTPRDWGQHLAARGMAVLLPNYRGSTGWGIEFAEANVGDLGGMDFQDVMSGVDAMIARGIADSNRLGIGGWSYGGFMTAWAIASEHRTQVHSVSAPIHFRAAVVGAGITNWLSFHGNSHLHTWDAIHYNTNPYERDGLYQKFSPMNYVSNIRTPTLILHGEQDRDVPVEQAYQFYRALKDHNVETRLVIYPREEHAISETNHVLDLLKRIVNWFESHLT